MLVDRKNIEQYIPQRSPMLMVHNLIEADSNHAITTLQIEPDNIFVQDGILKEPGLIENIAQTAAAQAGYYYKNSNLPVPVGFIAAIRNLEITTLPAVSTMLTTTITITNKVMEVTIVEGRVMAAGVTICSCEMRIFIKE